MSETAASIALGTALGDYSRVSNALSEWTGQQVGHVPVKVLGGPNDLVQILANLEGWQRIGAEVLLLYGAGLIREATKDHWRALAPRLRAAPAALRDKFLRLVDELEKAKKAKQDFKLSIGLIEPSFDPKQRTDRVFLMDLSPEELARHLYIFSHCAKPVREWLSEVYRRADRGQVFVKMGITDEGTLDIALIPGYGNAKLPAGVCRKVFDAQGHLLEEQTAGE